MRGGGKKGKKGKKGGGAFGFEEEEESGKGTLIKVGSQEEFDSLVRPVNVGGASVTGRGGGGSGGARASESSHAYNKKEKREQASVEEVLSAAEQFALRFL